MYLQERGANTTSFLGLACVHGTGSVYIHLTQIVFQHSSKGGVFITVFLLFILAEHNPPEPSPVTSQPSDAQIMAELESELKVLFYSYII
jgi:hypothetical protein